MNYNYKLNENNRKRFTATIKGFGKDNFGKDTILLLNIKKEGKEFRDHAWLNIKCAGPEGFATLKTLRAGIKVEFTAIPYKYTKRGGKVQLGLGNINDVTII